MFSNSLSCFGRLLGRLCELQRPRIRRKYQPLLLSLGPRWQKQLSISLHQEMATSAELPGAISNKEYSCCRRLCGWCKQQTFHKVQAKEEVDRVDCTPSGSQAALDRKRERISSCKGLTRQTSDLRHRVVATRQGCLSRTRKAPDSRAQRCVCVCVCVCVCICVLCEWFNASLLVLLGPSTSVLCPTTS